MNYIKLITWVLTTSASTIMCYAQQPPALSLEQCLAIALDENPTVMVADMEVKRSDYSRMETIGQLLPSINFGASYNRMLAKQVMYMNMDGFGAGSNNGENDDTNTEISRASTGGASRSNSGIKVGLDNSYTTGFNASMPLIAPQLWQSIKLSDSQILRNIELARSSRLDLVNQVKSAYYALLLATDSRLVIYESYDMARLTHETYTKMYKAEAASEYDVLRTSVAMKNIEPEMMQADIAVKQAHLQLLILMGVDSEFKFTPASDLSDYEANMYDAALAAGHDYSSNPTLALNEIDRTIAKRNLAIQRAAWYPTLSLSANYEWTSMSNGSPVRNFRWNPYSSIGLKLSFPIFEGGQRYSKVKQAKIQLAELNTQRENLQRSVQTQVELAVDNINLNVKQIASCAESVTEAEKAHDIMQRSFEIGAASYLELRDSELALTRSKLSRLQAVYNFLIAGSELELLLGNAPIEQYSKSNQSK